MQTTDKNKFSAIALTLFPDMFPGPLGFSLAGKALDKGLWSLKTLDIRDFATDKHATVDASPYGGGTGMVLKPDVVDAAVHAAIELLHANRHSRAGGNPQQMQEYDAGVMDSRLRADDNKPTVIYFSPRGIPLTQSLANDLKDKELILVCGRFEGLDQRVIEHHDMLEVSLGDFILSGGEIAAYALLDACVRLLPGVISKESALHEESFLSSENYGGLLEYPLYTRPSDWNERPVPDVLLSGNHEQISAWRLEQAKSITKARRPDLWGKYLDKQSKG